MKHRWKRRLLAAGMTLAMTITMAMGNAQALKVDEYEGATVVDGTGYADTRHIGDFPSTVLYSYGLVNGTATDEDGNVDMNLDSTLTRQEATTLLVRLLGAEEDALASGYTAPFTDVAQWAKPYVGYAYENGIVNGTSATTFSGTASITMEQFLTLVLRMLDYSDQAGDFAWNDPYGLAGQVGLLCPMLSGEGFTRSDAMYVAYEALDAAYKGQDITLLEQLKNQGAVTMRGIPQLNEVVDLTAEYESLPEQMDYLREEFGVTAVYADFSGYPSVEAYMEQIWNYCTERGYFPTWPEYIANEAANAQIEAQGLERQYSGDPAIAFERNQEVYQKQTEIIASTVTNRQEWKSHVSLMPADLEAYRDVFNPEYINMPLYREKGYLSGDQWDGFLELYEVAPDNGRQYLLDSMDWMIDFYEEHVTEGMSDYEIVKTLYNAVIDNTKYNYSLINRYKSQGIDVSNPSTEEREILEEDPEYWLCHSWMGFANGVDVVCDGYSEAFQLLMNMAGIPCVHVCAYPEDYSEGHQWNKVQLDGVWYNVDLTWADTNGNRNAFFLRSDAAFQRDGHEKYTVYSYSWYREDEMESFVKNIVSSPKDYR